MKNIRSRRRRGGALAASLFVGIICVALAAASITMARGWQGAASTDLNRERSFQLAEAGVDWAIARLRASHGVLPEDAEKGAIPAVGSWTVSYGPGDTNGRDDDGDGTVDEGDEGSFTGVLSTGTSGGVSRHIRMLLRTPTALGAFDAATVFNVDAPILDLNGDAFVIDGRDHGLDGTYDATLPEKYAVASPATTATLLNQVSARQQDNMAGIGGTPSLGQITAIDLNALVLEAQRSTTISLTPGTYGNVTLGEPVLGRTEVVSVEGDLHLSGGVQGAGILVVDGDLKISGSFLWTGIVLVRGRTSMVGGGSTKRLIGALVVGEEVGAVVDSQTVEVSGTIDLLYSSAAIDLAAQSLVVPVVVLWQEVGAP